MAVRSHSFTNSSSILAATWDDDSHELTIVFARGRSYVYENVPETVWDGFTSAPSAGQYFHQNIREVYS